MAWVIRGKNKYEALVGRRELVRKGAKEPVTGCCEHGNEPSVSIQYVTQEALVADQISFPYEPS